MKISKLYRSVLSVAYVSLTLSSAVAAGGSSGSGGDIDVLFTSLDRRHFSNLASRSKASFQSNRFADASRVEIENQAVQYLNDRIDFIQKQILNYKLEFEATNKDSCLESTVGQPELPIQVDRNKCRELLMNFSSHEKADLVQKMIIHEIVHQDPVETEYTLNHEFAGTVARILTDSVSDNTIRTIFKGSLSLYSELTIVRSGVSSEFEIKVSQTGSTDRGEEMTTYDAVVETILNTFTGDFKESVEANGTMIFDWKFLDPCGRRYGTSCDEDATYSDMKLTAIPNADLGPQWYTLEFTGKGKTWDEFYKEWEAKILLVEDFRDQNRKPGPQNPTVYFYGISKQSNPN